MVKYADLVICDSLNIEKYIKEARPKEAKMIQFYLRFVKLLIIVLLRTPS